MTLHEAIQLVLYILGFQDNPSKPVPECQTILDFPVAKHRKDAK